MGPIKGVSGLQSQVWAIHLAMKLAFMEGLQSVRIECDNVRAFDMLLDQDQEELEEEGLVAVVQQVNILYAEFNKRRSDVSCQRKCRLTSVFATRNNAPAYLAEYGLRNCTDLVEVLSPFGRFAEILDLDKGLGPHFPAFSILPNFGLGDVIHPEQVQERTESLNWVSQSNPFWPWDNFHSVDRGLGRESATNLFPWVCTNPQPWVDPIANPVTGLLKQGGIVINEQAQSRVPVASIPTNYADKGKGILTESDIPPTNNLSTLSACRLDTQVLNSQSVQSMGLPFSCSMDSFEVGESSHGLNSKE